MRKRPYQPFPPRSSAALAALLVAGLWLLAAPPAAGQAAAQKESPYSVDNSSGRIRFRDQRGLVFSEAKISENLVIFYNPGEIDVAFVDLVSDNLEGSWRFFHGAGYRHPLFADRHRVAVYIRTTFGDASVAGAFIPYSGSANPYFELRYRDPSVEGNLDPVRSTCTHEFFHFIQHAYDPDDSAGIRWLREATATWSEDERIPNAPWDCCYLLYMPRWYPLWSQGTSLNAFGQGGADVVNMPYGSSIYFKYLSEHHPAGADIVRRIWEGIGTVGAGDGMRAIQTALGGEEQFRDSFINFGVAALLKTTAPHSLRRGGEIASVVTPTVSTQDWYFEKRDESTNQIEPREITVGPYGVSYIEFIAPQGQAQPTRLRIIFPSKGAAAGLMSRVVRLSGDRAAASLVGVDDIPMDESGPWQVLVEDYDYRLDRTWRVFLLLANTTSHPIQVRVAAAVSEPPYLRRLVAVHPARGEELYRATWEERGANQMELVIQTDKELKVEENRAHDFRLEAEFSREIAVSPTLHVAGRSLTFQKAPGAAGDWRWSASVSGLPIDRELLEQRILPLRIEAASPDGLGLDTHPASVPWLDSEKLQWLYHDPPGGGPDGAHRLKLEKDLNGLWRAGDGTLIRIKHRGGGVDGFTMGNKRLFYGLLNESRITGIMKVRYPPEWVRRCGVSGEYSAAMEIAVSEDRDTLNGRFEMREIDEECNQSPAGWKQFTLQRVPEEEAKTLRR